MEESSTFYHLNCRKVSSAEAISDGVHPQVERPRAGSPTQSGRSVEGQVPRIPASPQPAQRLNRLGIPEPMSVHNHRTSSLASPLVRTAEPPGHIQLVPQQLHCQDTGPAEQGTVYASAPRPPAPHAATAAPAPNPSIQPGRERAGTGLTPQRRPASCGPGTSPSGATSAEPGSRRQTPLPAYPQATPATKLQHQVGTPSAGTHPRKATHARRCRRRTFLAAIPPPGPRTAPSAACPR